MKYLIYALTILLVFSSFTTNRIVISGDFGVKLDGKLYLTVVGDDLKSKTISSVDIKDGKFSLSVEEVKYPQMAYLGFQGSGHGIILENCNINIEYNRETGYSVKGGFYNELIFGWEKLEEVIKLNSDMNKLSVGNSQKTLTSDEVTNYRLLMTSKRDRISQFKREYLRNLINHPDDYVKLFALMEQGGLNEEHMTILARIKSQIPQNLDLLRLEKSIRDKKELSDIRIGLVIGAKYKDFKAQIYKGDTITLGEVVVGNQYTLLEFWASWCAPCRVEMKKLPDVYNKYRERGFEIFSFSIDAKFNDWLTASDSMNIPWINTSGDTELVNYVTKIYAISSIPNNFLLDSNGVIIAINIKSSQLLNLLDEKFK